MSTEKPFEELNMPPRADKPEAMEMELSELAAEVDLTLLQAGEYEVWSPFDAPLAAEELMSMLSIEEVKGEQ